MRFLIVTKGKHMVPPDMGLPMMDMMEGWLAQFRASGNIVDTWNFAGMIGGGGILEVESAEELDTIMQLFPFGGSSEIEIYPLSDLDASIARAKANMARIVAAMGGG